MADRLAFAANGTDVLKGGTATGIWFLYRHGGDADRLPGAPGQRQPDTLRYRLGRYGGIPDVD